MSIDWKAEYLKSVESGCITLDELREARAELDATNRQVEILSDALAESRREVAALKAVQEPVAFLANGTRFKISYDSRQSGGQIHGIPPELGGRWVAFVAAEDDCHLKLTTPPAAQPADQREWIETACALIKAADDAAADRDYMLDSDDCIAVLRGTWKAPLANDMPQTPPAQPAPVPCCGQYETCTQACTPRGEFLAKREAQAAQPAPVQPVAQAIIHAITEYGDARADQDANNAPTTSHERLADCIRLIRAAQGSTPPAQQEPVQEPVAVARVDDLERGGRVRALAMGLALDAALYTTPPAQPAPVQEHVAWGKPTDEMVQAATDEYDEWAVDNKGTTECIRAMLVKALKATPPAAAVQEGRDWSLLEATQESLREHIAEIKRLKSAQPAVPDAVGPNEDELPAYAAGWNDCRQAMMEMMK